MPILRLSAAALMLALAAPVHAADLYKCADASGVISIQSKPCASGSTQVWKRDTNPEPAPSAQQITADAARRQHSADTAREISLAAGTTRTAPAATPPKPVVEPEPADDPAQKGPCRRAHELAREIRALALLELKSDQLYRLDEWVVKQCEQARTGE